ncbi:MAG: hypothetical protein ACMUIG_01285 [Thermoplasmatota archaeon]
MSTMSRFIPLIAVALLTVSVLSMVVSEEPTESDKEPNLFGKVIDSINEKGISAVIHFGGGPENSFRYTAQSNEEGAFRLYLPPGEYVYEAEARGYMATRGELKMPDGQKMELSIKMDLLDAVKEGNLHGKVIDARTGEGIIAVVEFGGIETDIAFRAETDRSGVFSLLIRPGGYYYHSISEGYEPFKGEIKIGEGPQRLLIEMKRIRQEERDFGVVKGFVGSPDGKPIPGAVVTFMPFIEEHVKIREDGTVVENDVPPEPMEPITARTDERGHFMIRLRFGGYEVHAEARGYHPAVMPFRIGPDNPEAGIKIIMEGMENLEPGFGGLKVEIKKVDANSDGLPELIHIALDVNGDDKLDAEYHYEDENSDGNPEVELLMLDLPPEFVERAMNIILKLIAMRSAMPPMYPEYGMWEEDKDVEDPCCHGYDEDGMPREEFDPDADGENDVEGWLEKFGEWLNSGREDDPEEASDDGQTDDVVEDTDDPGNAGDVENTDEPVDKKSDGAPVVEILTALGMVAVIIGIIVLAAYFLVKRRK